MAYSAEESSPLTKVSDSCCICNEEFSSDGDLASHLLEHANEEKFKSLLAELEAKNGAKPPVLNMPMQTKRRGPEFIKTSFVREPPLRKKPAPPPPAEPEVWEIISDDDEPNDNQKPNAKKAKLSNSFRLVSSVNSGNTTKTGTQEAGPPFNCHSCTSVFNDSAAFREHLLTHEKPRPYVCHICKKSFAYKGTLRQHLHLHISDRSHECRVCHRKFSIKSVLRKHEESHELQQLQDRRNSS